MPNWKGKSSETWYAVSNDFNSIIRNLMMHIWMNLISSLGWRSDWFDQFWGFYVVPNPANDPKYKLLEIQVLKLSRKKEPKRGTERLEQIGVRVQTVPTRGDLNSWRFHNDVVQIDCLKAALIGRCYSTKGWVLRCMRGARVPLLVESLALIGITPLMWLTCQESKSKAWGWQCRI